MSEVKTNKVTKLAVFDFDGTIIPVQSGQKLSLMLVRTKIMKKRTALRLILWGARYKMHLPYSEDSARKMIFRCFEGVPANKVDEFIHKFCAIELEPVTRDYILDIAQKLQNKNIKTVVVSAAFVAILQHFTRDRAFDYYIGTHMEIDENGCYTGNVDGKPCSKKEKIEHLTNFADTEFGPGNWEITYAFSDHYTDKPLLKLAKNPVAVAPDETLQHYAKKHGWKIIECNKKAEKKASKQNKMGAVRA